MPLYIYIWKKVGLSPFPPPRLDTHVNINFYQDIALNIFAHDLAYIPFLKLTAYLQTQAQKLPG